MKNKFLSKVLCLLLALTLITPLSASKIAFADENANVTEVSSEFTLLKNEPSATQIDEKEWDFDAATNTLKGFKQTSMFNNPTDLVIPAQINGVDVKIIGENAFKKTTYGGSKVKNKIIKLTLPEGLEKTEYMSFQGNDIKEIKLPKSLKILGERTFFGNKNLTKIDFNDTVNLEEIGSGSLYETGLKEITIPEGVKIIGAEAFKGTPLSKVKLPDSLEEIGGQAFALCMVEEFTVPKNCKKIGLKKNGKFDGVFFRNFVTKDEPVGSKGKERFVKVYDETGNANVLNTLGVVNPQPITFKYVDENGDTVKPDETYVGYEKKGIKIEKGQYKDKAVVIEGDNHFYSDYIVPFDQPFGVSTTLSAKIFSDDELSKAIIGENYFTVGKTYEFEAPENAEYNKPDKQSITVSKDNHIVTFIYQDAGEKFPITLKGEGLTTNKKENKSVAGKNVKITVVEPKGKIIDKFLVDGVDHKNDLSEEGVGFIYKFDMPNKAVNVEVTYKKSEDEKFQFINIQNNMKLGGVQDIKLKYKGRTYTLPNKDIMITFKDSEGLVIKEASTLFARMSGENEVTATLATDEGITVTEKIKIDTCDVYLRFEDIDATVVPNTLVKIDKLFLKKNVSYHKDLEFEHPVPLLAMEMLLKAEGVNTANKDEFDCGLDGSWMNTLGQFKWAHINPNGSFMYMLNEKLASLVVSQQEIKTGDKLCVFYDANWVDGYELGEFEIKEYNIAEGETIKLKAFSHREIDKVDGETPDGHPNWVHVVEEPKPIVGGRIEVRNEKGEVKNIDGVTDDKGEISLTLNKAGMYNIVLFKDGTQFSRPMTVVKVKRNMLGDFPLPKEKIENKDKDDNTATDNIKTPNNKIRIVARSTKKNKGILIKWNKVEGMEGYEVWRSVNRNKGYKKVYSTKSGRYFHTKNLKKGVRYFYKVRGFKVIDGKKVYTSWSLKAFRVA